MNQQQDEKHYVPKEKEETKDRQEKYLEQYQDLDELLLQHLLSELKSGKPLKPSVLRTASQFLRDHKFSVESMKTEKDEPEQHRQMFDDDMELPFDEFGNPTGGQEWNR